ncbi:MAG: hypothetical protein BWX51_02155 [Bacteroidetes bacterium ADurb.Bin012]|nr:MAG: hypothetical protein BWX51_02155 [Bacteroidetes bacterium ADurb.Bin012]
MLFLYCELVFAKIGHIHEGEASEMVSEDIHRQCKFIGFHIGKLGEVVALLRYFVEKHVLNVIEILL